MQRVDILSKEQICFNEYKYGVFNERWFLIKIFLNTIIVGKIADCICDSGNYLKKNRPNKINMYKVRYILFCILLTGEYAALHLYDLIVHKD